jgi:hypothetical protein
MAASEATKVFDEIRKLDTVVSLDSLAQAGPEEQFDLQTTKVLV